MSQCCQCSPPGPQPSFYHRFLGSTSIKIRIFKKSPARGSDTGFCFGVSQSSLNFATYSHVTLHKSLYLSSFAISEMRDEIVLPHLDGWEE